MTTLLNGLWQGALLVTLVWIMLKTVSRLNAATRFAIWWITMLAAVILLLHPIGSTSHRSDSSAAPASTSALPPYAPVPAAEIHGLYAPSVVLNHSSTEAPAEIPSSTLATDWHSGLTIHLALKPVSEIIAAGWGLISLALLLRLAFGYRSLRRLKSRAAPVPEALQSRLITLRSRAGVARQARLLMSREINAPMALGLFDPVILIPQSLPGQISDWDFDHMALHELAHLRRFDDWLNLLQQILIALLPIQPVLFWIDRELALERETACDDWVVAVTGTPKPYAASLTRIAELTLWARCGILASGAAGRPSQLYQRIQRLLDKRRNIAPTISAIPLILTIAAIAALVVTALTAPQMIALADSPSPGIGKSSSIPATQPEAAFRRAGPGTLIKNFSVQPGDKLTVNVDWGNIHLHAGDQSEVRIVVTQKAPDLAEFMRRHQITLTQTGHEVRVLADAIGGHLLSSSNVDIDYDISVPLKFAAHLKTGAGNADASNLQGNLDAATGAGNIDVKNCTGAILAQTSAGNIDLGGIAGSAQGRTGAGNISAANCTAAMTLDTDNGNIDLEKTDASVNGRTGAGNFAAAECAGELQASVGLGNIDIDQFKGSSITAKTGSGNISADFLAQPKADCLLQSSMGNVKLILPPTIAGKLVYSTGMGNATSQFRRNNGSGPTLRAEAGVGNVQILRR